MLKTMNIQDQVQKIDHQYGTTEKAILPFKNRADKWDKLGEKTDKCFVDENGDELSED